MPRPSGCGCSRSPATPSPSAVAASAAGPEAPLEAAATIAAPIDLEADAGLRDEAAAALRAVERLPGDRRRALILRFVDEMTTAEIAGILGRSEGAVRVLIHRGLRSVARDLDDTGR